MIAPADFQSSLPKQPGLVSAPKADILQEVLSELVFTQSETGKYLSFCWQQAETYSLLPRQVIGSEIGEVFTPMPLSTYLERLRWVLENQVAEPLNVTFCWGQRSLPFELVMNPLVLPTGEKVAIVMGRSVSPRPVTNLPATSPLNGVNGEAPSTEHYQKLLTRITWNIRRTLDLTTIQQQTVTALGQALEACRCIIGPYIHTSDAIPVVAEYRQQEKVASLLHQELRIADDSSLQQALTTLKPVILHAPEQHGDSASPETLVAESATAHCRLIVATCYQDHPNGLIVLDQADSCTWSEVKIAFVQELADQVGTAIAHASLFAESQSLATELQRLNSNLIQKHRELEEASKQAEEASRLKSEFLANTSHELRTPLNGMIGFLKLILDGMAEDPEEQKEFIEEAYRSALHLLNIINDVLDIAKIEAGKMQIELSPVRLDELLTDVENFTRTQAVQKGLSFEIQKPPTHDEVILFGNYQRLLQVMLNLVGNAIKFTHEGGVTISAEVTKKRVMVQNQELPGMVKVRVADTGIGVSLDKQDKLFQSFSQVDGSRTRQYGGTGLGLAISQKLVEAMGGVVNFYSMGEGLGSTVTFTVPLYQEPVMIASQPTDAIDLLN